MNKINSVRTPLQESTRSQSESKVFGLVVLILFTVILLGCEGGKSPEPELPAPTGEGITATALAGEEPNQYSVLLHWPVDASAEKWVVHRRDATNPLALKQVAMVGGDQTSVEDIDVDAGQAYTYFISSLSGEHFDLKEQVKIETPKDLVLEGVHRDLHDIRGINRLYFKPGSVLVTGIEGLKVRVNELHSDSGMIETFSREEKSEAPTRGLNGGPISIHAQKAFGTLGLIVIGQAGGAGTSGLPGGRGATGAKGEDGEWGANPILFTRGYDKEQIEATVRRMKAKLPAPFDHNWKNVFGSHNDRNFACIRPPTDGAPGELGGQGTSGSDGADGGNSARVYIEVKNESDFVIDRTVESGAPGLPGEGGPGGPGGMGGPPGRIDRGCLCPRAKFGKHGVQGPKGPTGKSGRPGLKEPFCLKVNGVGNESCRHFKNEGAN